MDVSIIVPTYKRREKLKRLLESLLNQKTNRSYEIIVVDNGEDDETRNLCELFKVKYIKSGCNIGPGNARDLGTKYSNGKVLAFIDDDEYASSNWLDVICKNIRNKYVIYGPIKTNIKPFYPFIHSFDREEGIMPSGNFAIKRDIYIKVNGFLGANSFFGEDWYLVEKLRKIGIKPFYVKEMVVYHPALYKNWLTKDLITNSFKEYYYSIFLRKKIKYYPLEEIFNDILKKNLISLFLIFIIILIFNNKGILIYYLMNVIYFTYKSYIVSEKLSKNSIKFSKSQLIIYSFFGLFNQFIQLLLFNVAFYYFVFSKYIFYKEKKKDY